MECKRGRKVMRNSRVLLDVKGALDVANEHTHEGITFVRLDVQALENCFFHGRRDVRIDVARGNKIAAIELFVENLVGGFARERFLAGEQFVSADAVSKNVDALIDGLAQQLFGRHISWSARVGLGFYGEVRLADGQVEVDQTHGAVAGDQDVLGFEVHVNEPAVVNMFERNGHVDEQFGDIFGDDRIAFGRKEFQV